MRVAPEEPWAWDAGVVADAAFARYLREAADFAGGRLEIGRGLRPARGRGRSRAPAVCSISRRAAPAEPLLLLVVAVDAADDDPVLLDGDLDRPVARPVLGVDRVVLDRGVEPEPEALLAVVEGALERRGLRAPARRASATAAAAAAGRAVLLVAPPRRSRPSPRPRPRALGLGFGRFELGGDQRVVLGAQVDLLELRGGAVAASRRPPGRSGA